VTDEMPNKAEGCRWQIGGIGGALEILRSELRSSFLAPLFSLSAFQGVDAPQFSLKGGRIFSFLLAPF
jgi:hypothetical protein